MKNKAIEKSNSATFLKIFVFFSPFLFGGFHVWTSAVFTGFLCLYMFIEAYKHKGKMKISISLTSLSLLLIPAAYLAVSLWAVDSGTAIYGFVKFLPVALFALIIKDHTREEKKELMDAVPYSAAAMGVISYALSFIPQLSQYFLVAERLAGFFQYPNSFALYCLAGMIILLTKEKIAPLQWGISALLVGIILLTGSRTVFVFLVISVIVLFIRLQSANKLKLAVIFGGVLAAGLVIVAVTGNLQTVGRFLTISLESSTLLGRLLYYRDALPVILKHPFGLGYYGYYYAQNSFQTGVYSVAYVHNDILQLLLDIGWIPSLLFFFTLAKSFLSKNTAFSGKLLMLVILGHSFFDFDLQFISVFLLLILTMDSEDKKLLEIKIPKALCTVSAAVILVFSLYFGAVNSLFLLSRYEQLDRLYPNDTQSQIMLMTASESDEKAIAYADDILSRNKYIAVAYDVKANEAFSRGDILTVIEYKQKALDCSLYVTEEYNDFCTKLISVIPMYRQMGDEKSVDYCENVLIDISKRLEKVRENTSSLAWKIIDKPDLELEKEIAEYIKGIKR